MKKEIIVTKETLALYDKYEGDFGLLDELKRRYRA